jgi:hypothetical protein
MSYNNFITSQLYHRKSSNLYKIGFNFNNQDIYSEYLKIQNILYDEYYLKEESILTIMKKFNIPSSKTIDTLFKLFNIKTRKISESNQIALKTNRAILPNKNSFHSLWHTTWFDTNVYLRSSYEINYAKMLDKLKIYYFVEHLRIEYFDTQKNINRIALPDFYLPEFNKIVEIKSSYWYNPINMYDKIIHYNYLGYNFQLYLNNTSIISIIL